MSERVTREQIAQVVHNVFCEELRGYLDCTSMLYDDAANAVLALFAAERTGLEARVREADEQRVAAFKNERVAVEEANALRARLADAEREERRAAARALEATAREAILRHELSLRDDELEAERAKVAAAETLANEINGQLLKFAPETAEAWGVTNLRCVARRLAAFRALAPTTEARDGA